MPSPIRNGFLLDNEKNNVYIYDENQLNNNCSQGSVIIQTKLQRVVNRNLNLRRL